MRWKFILSAVASVGLLFSLPHTACAQAERSATIGGFPAYVGIGFSRYYLDYGPGRYMEGVVGWGGVDLWHGFGLDGSARSIFMNTPPTLQRMEQDTYLGGIHYTVRNLGRVRPYMRVGGGVGVIEFPSNDPVYTRDKYSVFAPSGGADVRVANHVYIRGEYEYQFWQDYHSPNYLNPQGFTVGAIYSFSNSRLRPHAAGMN